MGRQETGVAQIGHWIGGARHVGAADRTSEVFNPATGDVSGLVQLGGAAVVDAAVRAAAAAFPAWSETSALNRARVMMRARSSWCRSSSSLKRNITRARFSAEVSLQAG